MTDFKRDYRYVTQKFFDKWNDRIVKQIKAVDDRRISDKNQIKDRLMALEAMLALLVGEKE